MVRRSLSARKGNAVELINDNCYYPMNPKHEVQSQDWFKAALCAALFLLIIFLLFTRSSCSSTGTADSTSNVAEVSDSDHGAVNETPTEAGEEDAKTKVESKPPASPEKESPEKGSDPLPENAAVDSSPATPMPTNESESDPAGSPSGEPRGQSIGGMNVKGEKLGVILDISGSMSRYLDSLRTEINSRFEAPVFLEVEGCLLEESSFDAAEIRSPRSENPNLRESVMNSIRELVEVHQVDSVYWFCDLQDERTEVALAELMTLAIGGGNTPRGFHLYVRSTDENPDPKLKNIIESSGGAFEKRR